MRTVQLFGQIAQRPQRQHAVVLHGPRGVDHHDIDLRLHVAVLEAVVHDDEVHPGVFGSDAADALGPLLADGHHRLGKLELDLQRLVAHVAVVRIAAHLPVALRAAAVAAR